MVAREGARLSPEDREYYAQAVWQEFQRVSGSKRLFMSPLDWHIIATWMDEGTALVSVFAGLRECSGRGANLAYYERSVAEAARRRARALG